MTGRGSLRRPTALSAGLLLLGTLAIVVRNEVVLRADQWAGYRDELQQIIRGRPWRIAHGLPVNVTPSEPAPGRLVWHVVVLQAMPTAATLLVAGSLSLLLVSLGRRVLWLPVALAGLSLHSNVVYLRFGDVDDQAVPALTASLLVILAAAVPILLRIRGVRRVQRMPNRHLLPAMIVVGVAFFEAVQTFGPWYAGDSDTPEVAPAFALFAFAALLVASPLRRRWLPLLLVAPLSALPPLGVGIADYAGGYGWDPDGLTWVFWGGAFMLALGALTPGLGRLAVSLWQRLPADRPPQLEAATA